MLPAALVTKDISPNIRLLPALMTTATPSPASSRNGSAKEVVVRSSTSSTNATAMAAMVEISLTVLVVATAVETALPVMALSSPMIWRMASTAVMRFSLAMVTENSALPSL